MLLITIICYLWQGIAKEQVDFYKMASDNTSTSIKYDYLYTILVNAESLCSEGDCYAGKNINFDNYNISYEANICEFGGKYYAFYTESILTQKPRGSLETDSEISLIDLEEVPSICKKNSYSEDTNYALLKEN